MVDTPENTSVGDDSLTALSTGIFNAALGPLAMRDTTLGSNNTAIGASALRANLAGEGNTVVGSNADRVVVSGSRNVSIGCSVGLARTTGSRNVLIGFGAVSDTILGGDQIVAIGYGALQRYDGGLATAVGYEALKNAKGVDNTALGTSAGAAVTTGTANIFVGHEAGVSAEQKIDVRNSIVIGAGAHSDTDDQIVLGTAAQSELRMFGISFARYSATGESLYLGGAAGGGTHTGTANIAIGMDAMHQGETTGGSTAIGRYAMYWVKGGGGNLAIGTDAMKNGDNPTPGVLPPGTVLGSPTDCTAIGNEAGRDWQAIVGAVAIGRISQAKTTTGTGNVSVGDATLRDNLTGEFNVSMGYGAMGFNVSGSRNVALGNAALYRGTAGMENCAVGVESLEFAEGDGNVGIGLRAGRALTSATDNIMIGRGAGADAAQKADAKNSIAIGAGVAATADNQVLIGNAENDEFVFGGISFTRAQLEALKALVAS